MRSRLTICEEVIISWTPCLANLSQIIPIDVGICYILVPCFFFNFFVLSLIIIHVGFDVVGDG